MEGQLNFEMFGPVQVAKFVVVKMRNLSYAVCIDRSSIILDRQELARVRELMVFHFNYRASWLPLTGLENLQPWKGNAISSVGPSQGLENLFMSEAQMRSALAATLIEANSI